MALHSISRCYTHLHSMLLGLRNPGSVVLCPMQQPLPSQWPLLLDLPDVQSESFWGVFHGFHGFSPCFFGRIQGYNIIFQDFPIDMMHFAASPHKTRLWNWSQSYDIPASSHLLSCRRWAFPWFSAHQLLLCWNSCGRACTTLQLALSQATGMKSWWIFYSKEV